MKRKKIGLTSGNYDSNRVKQRRIEIELGKLKGLQDGLSELQNATDAFLIDGSILALNQEVTASSTIPEGQNGLSVGPLTIAQGTIVTVAEDSIWKIL